MDKGLINKSDNYLIRNVKENGDNESFLEVCRRTEDLFYKVCQKYSGSLSSCGIHVQDIFDEKNIIILHCIKTFNPKKKTKLSSWIGNYARYLCLNSMNARRLIIPSIDEEIHQKIEDSQTCHDYFENSKNINEYKDHIFHILNELQDKRIKKIFELRYLNDKKMIWNKIAKKMKTSPQTIILLHKKGVSIIKNKIMEEDLVSL